MAMLDSLRNTSPNEEVKTQFMTREGIYRLMTLSEYSRPNRVGYANNGQGAAGVSAPVKVSFASVPASSSALTPQEAAENGQQLPSASSGPANTRLERITFNFGREIFVYPYKGVRKAADLTKPIDKRVYKGTFPTCHDFSQQGDLTPLIVGFSGGQIQLVDPIKKELSKLFNEERHIDKTRVTCIKWLPESTNCFLVSYASGNIYVYDHELMCCPGPPAYQLYKQGRGHAVYTCKVKGSRNPLYKWAIGKGSLNEFAFSPCGRYLATVSQDGHLRVFVYSTFELVGLARSYFGGLLCVCWSPDSRYVVFGGEDDLVNVYCLEENRVVVRGQGHKSWVSVVAFDHYNISYGELPDGIDFSGSDDEGPSNGHVNDLGNRRGGGRDVTSSSSIHLNATTNSSNVTCYRFGSVGQDTLICLWDVTEDVLKQSSALYGKTVSQQLEASSSSHNATPRHPRHFHGNAAVNSGNLSNSNSLTSKDSGMIDGGSTSSVTSNATPTSLTQRLASLNFVTGDRNKNSNSSGDHRRNFSLPTRGSSASAGSNSAGHARTSSGSGGNIDLSSSSLSSSLLSASGLDDVIDLGSAGCPRLSEVPLIEPLVTKKIAHERLTALVFREECLVTACQDGYVCTWARPGKMGGGGGSSSLAGATASAASACPSSPRPSPSYGTTPGNGTGTIV